VLLTEIKDSNDDTWDIPGHCADIPESNKIGVEKSQEIKNFIANNRSSFATSYQEIGTCNVSEFSIKLVSDEPIYILGMITILNLSILRYFDTIELLSIYRISKSIGLSPIYRQKYRKYRKNIKKKDFKLN